MYNLFIKNEKEKIHSEWWITPLHKWGPTDRNYDNYIPGLHFGNSENTIYPIIIISTCVVNFSKNGIQVEETKTEIVEKDFLQHTGDLLYRDQLDN